MSLKNRMVLLCALATGASVGCAAPTIGDDGELGLGAGKADGSGYSECEKSAMTSYVNGISLGDEREARDALRHAGVPSLAAKCIVWWRLGMDSCPAGNLPSSFTPEPRTFDDAAQIDDVRGTGGSTFEALAAAIAGECSGPPPSGAQAKVIFSPQLGFAGSHAQEIVNLLNSPSTRSADIAMYSFSQAQIKAAVIENASRIPIRVIYDRGHLQADAAHPGTYNGGLEAGLEEAGIEVRTVNQDLHHKFAIFNAVHEAGDDPADVIVSSGSANWSQGAVDTYDEATIITRNSPELGLRFQREFNRLWARSSDVPTAHDEGTHPFDSTEITDEMIAAVDVPDIDVIFTSDNFRDSSGGFTSSKSEGYHVADRWVEAIDNAESSVWIFQERLRSVPIANALLRKVEANPDFEIRVYLDNQEYVTDYHSDEMESDLAECYSHATTDTQHINCESGMYYSYIISRAFEGHPNQELRLKYYSYNWHYSFEQMHFKSMIVDGRWIFTGSYNLSSASEFGNMENVMIFDGDVHHDLLDSFEEQFDIAWNRGHDQYDEMMAEVNGSDAHVPIRLVEENGLPPISMTWAQVAAYRGAVYRECGSSQLYELRNDNERAMWCERQ